MSLQGSPQQGPAATTSHMLNIDPIDEVMGKSHQHYGAGESQVGPLGRTSTGENENLKSEEIGMNRAVSTLDAVAYGKHELNGEQQRNVMKRMFEAFDMQHTGHLNKENTEKFLKYLAGGSVDMVRVLEKALSEEAVVKDDKLLFDGFWTWWQKYEKEGTKSSTFQMVSAKFSAPFHQQQLQVSESGEKFTPNYRVHFAFKDVETGEVKPVSPWHDIPLMVRDVVRTTPEHKRTNKFNFICEIPKWTRAKFEISTKEPLNPIKQDMKNGVPRFYMHGDMMWNYGAFPQTWESTEITFVEGVKGDNDPVDAIEIGMTQLGTGTVAQVKILGVLGMIDAGEMDWKVICINRNDPIAKFLNDIHDVPKHLPGCLDSIREWLRTYKICQGGTENTFAFDGEYKDKEYTLEVIDESHRMWNNLVKINQTSEV